MKGLFTSTAPRHLYYVLTDHLGSWNKVMDENKNIVQQTHFDPWGNRMTYTDWALPQTQTDFTFVRGFTLWQSSPSCRTLSSVFRDGSGNRNPRS